MEMRGFWSSNFLICRIFNGKCAAGIIELVQEWFVVVHTIRVLTPVYWVDMSEDAVKEAQVVILVIHVHDGFPTFDELWGRECTRNR